MITFILSFLAIACVGVLIFMYLRQEQEKSLPKPKYEDPLGGDQQIRKIWARALQIKVNKSNPVLASLISFDQLVILLITFGLAAITAALYGSILYESPGPFIVLALVSPISLPLFPGGLIAFIRHTYDWSVYSGLPLLTAWTPYVIVFLTGAFIKNRMVFVFIYLVFIMLLLMNIEGCAKSLPDLFSGFN